MANLRSLTLGTLSILTVAATVGCGAKGLPTNATAAMGAAPRQATITVQGVSRNLGYDLGRYDQVLSKRSHKKHLHRQGLLRSRTDNRENCSPIADQGHLGSCTAFAMGRGLREYLAKKNGERTETLSGLWLYYQERVQMGTVGYDSGATITDGMEVLGEKGCATEQSWPYDITKFTIKPPSASDATAAEFKIHDGTELDGLDDAKTAIAAGQPVAFGFRVYESFRKIGADGVMPIPAPGEKLLGGHAVLAVGYDDEKKALIVRNSWGEKWGDKGYFYMPYEAAKTAARDWWTASK